jgi:hypothetical protein
MNPVLQQLQSEIAQSIQDLTPQQTQLRPVGRAEKWTIEQIVEHLCLTYASTSEVITNRLAKGRPTKAAPSLAQHCMQFYVTRFGGFPAGRKAPVEVSPPEPSPDPEDQRSGILLTSEIERRLAEMDVALGLADERFGLVRCASHGVLGPLTSSGWRRFHLVHGRHHIKQISAIRRDHRL